MVNKPNGVCELQSHNSFMTFAGNNVNNVASTMFPPKKIMRVVINPMSLRV